MAGAVKREGSRNEATEGERDMKKLMVVQCVAVMLGIIWLAAWLFTFMPFWTAFPMMLTTIAIEIGLATVISILCDEGSGK